MRRSFGRAARDYDAAAVLQSRVRAELLDRLDVVRLEPCRGPRPRRRHRPRRRWPSSAAIAEPRWWRSTSPRACCRRPDGARPCCGGSAACAPMPRHCRSAPASVDLVFSNLMLQWCNDPDAVFLECRRVLKPGGLLTFTTFGPDTLVELRRAWAAAADGHTHVNRFIDMHDLGDALLRSGLVEPVMDVERYTLTYATVRDLMRRPEGDRGAQRQRRTAPGPDGQGRVRAHDGRVRRVSPGGPPARHIRSRFRAGLGAAGAVACPGRAGGGDGADRADRTPQRDWPMKLDC